MYRTLLSFNFSVLVSERNYRISQSCSWRRGVKVILIASTFLILISLGLENFILRFVFVH